MNRHQRRQADARTRKAMPDDRKHTTDRELVEAYLADKIEWQGPLGVAPAYHATNWVRLRGQRLSRIIWRGRQWAVTKYGIECRDGTYVIAKRRLWENEATYGWVKHMSEKEWVDLPDFAEALRIARGVHAKHAPRPSQGKPRSSRK